jgi:H+/Cl- antiporter ClcA
MRPSTYLQLLSLIFIACKLTGTIDWSWWLVLAPIWTMPLIALTVGAIVGFVRAWKEVRAEQKGKGTPEV